MTLGPKGIANLRLLPTDSLIAGNVLTSGQICCSQGRASSSLAGGTNWIKGLGGVWAVKGGAPKCRPPRFHSWPRFRPASVRRRPESPVGGFAPPQRTRRSPRRLSVLAFERGAALSTTLLVVSGRPVSQHSSQRQGRA